MNDAFAHHPQTTGRAPVLGSIMQADNKGEGGTLSLAALVQRALARRPN